MEDYYTMYYCPILCVNDHVYVCCIIPILDTEVIVCLLLLV